jgi:thioredoxin-related protein
MLRTVLEASSCLKYFELAASDESAVAVRCISRLVFSAAGGQKVGRVPGLVPAHRPQ